MDVKIIEPSGYCSGVANAFKLAKEVAQNYKGRNIVVLGMLVHNNDALKELDELNIKTIYQENKSYLDLIDLIKDDDIVILTAHGHPFEVEKRLKERNIKYFDATCPFVKLAHKQIKETTRNNHQVIYIGKKNHPEAISALSLSNDVILYEIKEGCDLKSLKDKSPLLISQTTFSKLDVNIIEKNLKRAIPGLRFAPSVCNASLIRQEALLNIDKNIDSIIVVGGKNSNNTKTLHKLALSHFPNSKIFFIQNKNDLNKKDLLGLSNVAIISGTSSPKYILEEIRDYLLSLN